MRSIYCLNLGKYLYTLCMYNVHILGLVIRTRCPSPKEMKAFAAPDLASFRNRKGCYGIVVMAACRANLEFFFLSAKHTGSTNDVVAIQGCEGGRILLDTSTIKLPANFYGVGDEAFVCTDVLLTPWSGRGLSRDKDSFNFFLSAMRQCIERAFGVFMGRWGIFRRPLTFGANKWGLVLGVCAKLHNFVIRHGEAKAGPPLAADIQVGDEQVVVEIDNAENNEGASRTGGQGSALRRQLTTKIGEWGHVRPPANVIRNEAST